MRERPVPCRNATLREFVAGRHRTFNDDAVCDRCAASLSGRARDRGQGAPPQPAPTHLTPAQPATATPVPFDAALFDGLEATNATTGDVETVEIGPLFGRYLTLSAPDLLVSLDALKRLADEAQVAVMDARQDKADAERHECWCGTMLEADELTCGAPRCNRAEFLDAVGLVP